MKHIIALIILTLPILVFGNDYINITNNTLDKKKAKINLYGDAGTWGLVHSLFMNLETYITSSKSDKLHLYLRGAYGDVILFSGGSGTSSFHRNTKTKVGALTLITGKGEHHFDSSAGIFIRDDDVLPFLDLGYRFQNINGGIIFRGKVGILGLGVGLGYAF